MPSQTKVALGLRIAMALALGSAGLGLALAQVSKPTQAEKETAPLQFRAEVTGDDKFKNYERKTTPPGVYPNTGPHDFTGIYSGGNRSGGGAAPGVAAGGPPGGAAGNAGAGGARPAGGGGPGNLGSGKPGQICVPTFSAGIGMGYPTHIFMTPERMTIVAEENHRIRRVYINGEHSKGSKPTYGGDSIAHWDGDTLVVETVNIRGQEGQTLIEKIRKIDGGRSLEIVSSTNGGAERTSTAAWRPDLDWVEDVCEDFGEAFGEGYL